MKLSLVTTCIACLFVCLSPVHATANTFRYIYNQSSCDLRFGATTYNGTMRCNGGTNYFKVPAKSTAKYELTTTGGVSSGKFYVYKGFSQVRSTDVNYHFSTLGDAPCNQETVKVKFYNCMKVLQFQKHTPICGDLTILEVNN